MKLLLTVLVLSLCVLFIKADVCETSLWIGDGVNIAPEHVFEATWCDESYEFIDVWEYGGKVLQNHVITDPLTAVLMTNCPVDPFLPPDPVDPWCPPLPGPNITFVNVRTGEVEDVVMEQYSDEIWTGTVYSAYVTEETTGVDGDNYLFLSYGDLVEVSGMGVLTSFRLLCDGDHTHFQIWEITHVLLGDSIARQLKKLEDLDRQLQYIDTNLPEWEGSNCDNNDYVWPRADNEIVLQEYANATSVFYRECWEEFQDQNERFNDELASTIGCDTDWIVNP